MPEEPPMDVYGERSPVHLTISLARERAEGLIADDAESIVEALLCAGYALSIPSPLPFHERHRIIDRLKPGAVELVRAGLRAHEQATKASDAA